MLLLKKYHFFLFIFFWTAINYLQAANTVLLNDEAYYWVYSNYLAWGYFDHPPMIALLIKGGYLLFKNELGVRFFMVVLNTLTLLIIYYLLPRQNTVLFYAISCSLGLLQLGGFIAAPDTPLVFFVALFFLTYQRFLVSSSWPRTVVLGIVMALLLYSKYHGVLVIICTLVSNPLLLKNKKAYGAVAITVLLFIPHLYWQYSHGFPSVQYHLFERSETYKTAYTFEYVLGQLILAGPFMGWLLLFGAFKYATQSLWQRALKFTLVGIYCFFLLSTFKGRVEANWTVPAIIPLIILSHQYFYDRVKWQRILLSSVPFSLLVVIFIRVYLTADDKFITLLNTNEFEQNKTWAKKINALSRGVPVVFMNSYQKASKYWFYSGIPSLSLNGPGYRRNNYNYWPVETSLQGKAVYAMSAYDPASFPDSIKTSAGILRGRAIDNFYSHSGIELKAGDSLIFNRNKHIIIHVLTGDRQKIPSDKTVRLELFIYQENEFRGNYLLLPTSGQSEENNKFVTTVPVLLPPGNYIAKLAISTALPGYPSLNSTNIKFSVKQ